MRRLIERIAGGLAPSGGVTVTGVEGSSAAFLLAGLARLSGRRRILAAAPSVTAANRLVRDLEYFLGGELPVRLIPAYDTLPFEDEDPDAGTTAERLAALSALADGGEGVWVATSVLFAQRLIPPDILRQASLVFSPGMRLDPQATARHLEVLGFIRVPLVGGAGEYSVRGDIVDLWSPGWREPLRIDLFGDTVETLRWFDPSDQRSVGPAENARLAPATEIVGPNPAAVFRKRTTDFCRPAERDATTLARIISELQSEGARPRHASLLPLFYQDPATILDYAEGGLVALVDPAAALHEARGYAADLTRRGSEAGYGEGFLAAFTAVVTAPLATLERGSGGRSPLVALAPVAWAKGAGEPIPMGARPTVLSLGGSAIPSRDKGWPAMEQISKWAEGSRLTFVCRTGGAARRLADILAEYGLGVRVVEGEPFDFCRLEADDRSPVVHVGELKDGFAMAEEGITFVTEEDLFGPKRRVRDKRPSRTALFDLDFSSLKAGDWLVHEDHGIGSYGGLTKIRLGDHEEDMLTLLYAEGGRLYVPMDQLYLVQRYIASEGSHPRPDRLGGRSWEQIKTRARKAIRTMVRELLRTQARRQAAEGCAFSPDGAWQKEFEAAFEYEETPDQWHSIEDVKRDMESPRPMDRVVCGDVGYGKTEVAMRAAFKAAADGRQVAMLAPTTVLCHQHHITFSRRFAPFPFRVEVLSRFTPKRDEKKILADLTDGTVDVVIGTHRLFQKDVAFRDLGLLIVDEEHRFGVRDKERLKELAVGVDILTLSATPIPRTFSMAMSGLRDLSVIETPPVDRLGVKTKVIQFSEKVIREAILRELARDGQVFFLHNRVRSIYGMARYLQEIVPEATIGVAHGQMGEGELRKVMDSFVTGGTKVLLSTSIVESGLDIPNANTMIINRADRFGLADLYQLRGRIGRSSQQAWAYLMVPGGRLTPEARQRLAAIEEFSELGAGVRIAALDLEIRGAGNLLGYEQSGRLAEIGLELYTRMIEEVVAEMKGEAHAERALPRTEISVPWPAALPESWLPDVSQRLTFYKRLSLVEGDEALARLAEEMEDIFGHPPPEVRTLLQVAALRVAARRAGIERVSVAPTTAEAVFNRATPVEPARILDLIARSAGAVRLKGEDRLLVALGQGSPSEVLARLRKVLLELTDCGTVSTPGPPGKG
jgi:transcription-repair coupling factor (superfamily II helicase)